MRSARPDIPTLRARIERKRRAHQSVARDLQLLQEAIAERLREEIAARRRRRQEAETGQKDLFA